MNFEAYDKNARYKLDYNKCIAEGAAVKLGEICDKY